MRDRRTFFIFILALWLALEAGALVAQEHFLTLTGTVVAIQGGARKWLDVKSETDEVTVSFRIGRNTVYVPSRYPNVGEKVRVVYMTEKGVSVATKVLIFSKEQTD